MLSIIPDKLMDQCRNKKKKKRLKKIFLGSKVSSLIQNSFGFKTPCFLEISQVTEGLVYETFFPSQNVDWLKMKMPAEGCPFR